MATSASNSFSASPCFMSLAMEKNTCSTLKFVFALCSKCYKNSVKIRRFQYVIKPSGASFHGCHMFYSYVQGLTVSKNFIPYSSANAWPLEVETAWKNEIKHKAYIERNEKKLCSWIQVITLLLSSASALLPTNILLTLSGPFSSMSSIHCLMSAKQLGQKS